MVKFRQIGAALLVLVSSVFPVFSSAPTSSIPGMKTVKVGFFQDNSTFMSSENGKGGRKSGYAYEFLQTVANHSLWQYEYVFGTWTELSRMLAEGKIDLLPGVAITDRRKEQYLFPNFSMGHEVTSIYTWNGNTELSPSDPQTLTGKTIAVESNTSMIDHLNSWLMANNVKCRLLKCDSIAEMYSILTEKRADAIVAPDIIAHESWKSLYRIDLSEIFIAVSRNRKDLLLDLNNALQILTQINPFHNEGLQLKYYMSKIIDPSLGAAEEQWLSRHFYQIKVGLLNDGSPLCFYNGKTQKAEGAAIEFLKSTIAELNAHGVSMTFSFFDSKEELISALEKCTIDLAFPMMTDFFEAEGSEYMLSDTVFTIPMELVYNGDHNLFKKIAISENFYTKEYMASNFAHCIAGYYNSREECLEAIIRNKCDGAIINSQKLDKLLYSKKEYMNLKVFDLQKPILVSFAVRRTSPGLLTLINKGIAHTTEEEFKSFFSIYEDAYEAKNTHPLEKEYIPVIVTLLIFISTILAIILFILIKLKLYTNYDPLTHLYTKRNLKSSISTEMIQAQLNKTSLSLLLIDIDNFRKIKKEYGRSAGDSVLVAVAKNIVASTNKGDYAFRITRDLFCVLVRADLKTSRMVAERIRNEVTSDPIVHKKFSIEVTVTIGVVQYKEGNTPKQLMRAADKNLFEGKQTGRNKIVL